MRDVGGKIAAQQRRYRRQTDEKRLRLECGQSQWRGCAECRAQRDALFSFVELPIDLKRGTG